jgi:hypothetical protein
LLYPEFAMSKTNKRETTDMKTPTFKSLTSLLLFGALAGAQLTGCGTQGDVEAEDAEVSSTTGALSRTAAVADVDTSAATPRTTTVTKAATPTKVVLTTVPSVTLTPGPPPAGTDYERNHPWSVYISGTGGLNCRGTLIHPSWVLTAGHCMGPYAGTVSYTRTDPATGAVVTDSRQFDQAGAQRGMFRHPDYVADAGFGQPENDIMLIRLATPFTINSSIQTAALPRFFANPGRTGTIATNNHSNAPAGYVSIVRTQQLPTCTGPSGFICISPPAGSLCHGDSGSGFVEILDGRAQLVGITSNIDSSSGDDCIAANKQAELVDVYAYRDWIYGTMGMSPEQADGRVRLRWSGFASQPGIMSLQCLTTGSTIPAVEVSMNVPGSEIAMDNCDDVRVFCQTQGANLNIGSFTKRTIAPNGALTATQSLPVFPTFTVDAGDAGGSFLSYNCGVYNLMNPAIDLSGVSSVATAAF